MADVTISSLPLGTPSSSALLPYSDGNNTYSARPSAIVAASSGSTIQMIQYVFNGPQSYNSTTAYVDTFMTGTITPKFNTSKVLVSINSQIAFRPLDQYWSTYNLVRNNTQLIEWGVAHVVGWVPAGYQYLDSPASSSLLTYKVQQKVATGTGTSYFGWGSNNPYATSTLILTEIAG